jgi:hypothetical protein
MVAFKVETASTTVPIQIIPSCGFLKPGENKIIGILWPETHDPMLLPQTNFFIKSLPVQRSFFGQFEEMEPNTFKYDIYTL